ncbi:hypothetical protein GUK69_11865 [Stenotrophomonas maltophilia]|nr:hypothetical protein [Stenotrophomonas maltophilia]
MAGTSSPGQSEMFPFHRGVLPVEGELLSSYLLRLADAHSADHYRFYSSLLPGAQIWNRDIDRAMSGQLAQLLIQRCELSEEVVSGLSLAEYEALISDGGKGRPGGRGVWINSLGVFHRTRTLGGLQVCPMCLAQARVYKRIWRLSFVTCCPDHLIPLQSVCSGCSAPIVPHRQLVGTTTCHSCHVDHIARSLFREGSCTIPPGQRMLIDALAGKEISTLCAGIPLRDLVKGVSLLRRWGMLRVPIPLKGSPIETQSPIRRAIYFDLLHELTSRWPNSMNLLAVRGRVSRQTFESASPPDWLVCMGGELSTRARSRAKASGRSDLSSYLRQLQATKPAGWRELRASALTRAAME